MRTTKNKFKTKLAQTHFFLSSHDSTLFQWPVFTNVSNPTFNEFFKTYKFISFINIIKVFYVLNYGIKFYIYSASGTIFKNQLKYLSK